MTHKHWLATAIIGALVVNACTMFFLNMITWLGLVLVTIAVVIAVGVVTHKAPTRSNAWPPPQF